MAGFVLLLHVVGWGVLIFAVAPHDYRLGSTGVLGVGVGLTAYMLGVRHAFDADHIASIDNTTRKLVGEGKSSVSTGFWFSLGHSSVVFAASLLLVAGVRSVAGVVKPEDEADEGDIVDGEAEEDATDPVDTVSDAADAPAPATVDSPPGSSEAPEEGRRRSLLRGRRSPQ
jgi:hypothetical protein